MTQNYGCCLKRRGFFVVLETADSCDRWIRNTPIWGICLGFQLLQAYHLTLTAVRS
ncbi:hypothetical protein [Nostoc sp.]|uniref:hypothetical protein n=1 Tax=Nostoc sp. TaxID=1180 RepID=UPI002FFA7D7C